MIFKTFNSDIDKWTAKIGVLGKSFNDFIEASNKRKIVINDLFTIDGVPLKDAKKQAGSFWSYLYPKKEDIKLLEIAVPDLINPAKANEYIDIMKQIDSGTHDVFKTFQEWYDSLADGEKWIAKHGQETKGQIRNIEGVTQANQEAREAAIAHNAALKQQTLGAKAAAVGMKALSIAGNMIAFLAITKGIELVVKGSYNLIHSTELAKEKISDLQDEYSNAVSELESVKKEFESINEKIDELQSKGKLSFTDKEELNNLKQQSLELERQVLAKEKLAQQKAQETVSKIKESHDDLDKDFNNSLNNYTDAKKTLEEQKKTGLNLLLSGQITQENYDSTISQSEETLNKYYGTLLDNIEKYEQDKQSILDKYNNDVSSMSPSDKALYNDIVNSLNRAYAEIYSKSEYKKFVIDPIFDKKELANLQQGIMDYFINNGSMDITALKEKFGSSIIDALRLACEEAGIELDALLSILYNQAKDVSYGFAPNATNKPNSADEAKQKAKLDYYNLLDDETKKLINESEIPKEVQNGTVEIFKKWVSELQKSIDKTNILWRNI